MIDLTRTIEAKSDHLVADDLIGGSLTITVTKVSVNGSDRPVTINYQGDNGKPYIPCKSMRRVLVGAWGANGADYVGQSMTLYCDKTVKFGGQEVGGVRISHVSGIDKPLSLPLSVARGKKAIFKVEPLVAKIQNQNINFDSIDDIQVKISQVEKDDNLNEIYRFYASQNHPELQKIVGFCKQQKEVLSMQKKQDDFGDISPSDEIDNMQDLQKPF